MNTINLSQLLGYFERQDIKLRITGSHTLESINGYGIAYAQYSHPNVLLQLSSEQHENLKPKLEKIQKQTGLTFMIYDNIQNVESGSKTLEQYFKKEQTLQEND